jgi:hypothetical protein
VDDRRPARCPDQPLGDEASVAVLKPTHVRFRQHSGEALGLFLGCLPGRTDRAQANGSAYGASPIAATITPRARRAVRRAAADIARIARPNRPTSA